MRTILLMKADDSATYCLNDILRNLRSKKVKECVLVCCLLMSPFFRPLARAADYYIDNSSLMCSDTGEHTQSQPWCDFNTFNATTFVPGDAIYLKSGDIWNQSITLNGSGSKTGGYITLTKYGAGKKPKLVYGSNTPTVVIYGTNISYWKISGLEIEDSSTVAFDPSNQLPVTSAILIYYNGTGPYSNITISNNLIHGAGTIYNNILLDIAASYTSRSSPVAENISITGNTIYDAGKCLVDVGGETNGVNMTYRTGGYSNLTFSGNTAYNSGLQGVVLRAMIKGKVGDNFVHDTGLYTGTGETWGPVALWALGSSESTFENNEVYNSFDGNTGYDASGIDVDWDNSYVTVQSNYLHDNQGAGVEVLSSDHTSVLNNRIYNNAGKTNMPAQISLNDFGDGSLHGITNATIANNVVVLSSADAIALSTSGTTGYTWNGNNYSNQYVLFADSSNAYDLEIDGVGVMATVNDNTFYSGTGTGFEGAIDGTSEPSLQKWRNYTGFDTGSSEAVGTSVSQQAADFTPKGHTSNQWTYLYSEDGESTFLDMKWNESPELWEGTESKCVIGPGWEQPGGISCDAVLVWSATETGNAVISADSSISVQAGCGGSGVDLRILQNGNQIWPSSGWESLANGDSFTFPTFTTAVNVKDQLQFVIRHAGSNNDCDATYWNPIVVFYP